MKNLKKALALTLTALLASSALYMTVLAEDENDPNAGIDFIKGSTSVDPGPDTELDGIKNGNLFFGQQEISASTITYNSVKESPDEERKHAGFVVKAGNTDGWTVYAQITGFEMDDEPTMKNFTLELTPGGIVSTPNNTGLTPVVYTQTLSAKSDGTLGASAKMFEATSGRGLGKWGCNWEGDLTVPGGSVNQVGSATAIMLWSLNPTDVQI